MGALSQTMLSVLDADTCQWNRTLNRLSKKSLNNHRLILSWYVKKEKSLAFLIENFFDNEEYFGPLIFIEQSFEP